MALNATIHAVFSQAVVHPQPQFAVATYLAGLAPTQNALGAAIDTFEAAIQSAAPSHAASFITAAARTRSLLSGHGTVAEFTQALSYPVQILKKMTPEEMRAVLTEAGFSAETTVLPGYEDLPPEIVKAALGIDTNAMDMLLKLHEFASIPSISDETTMPNPEVEASAQWVAQTLRQNHFEDVQIIPIEGGNPAVFGQIHVGDDKPTVLIYAHHDVQPIDDKWTTLPFNPIIRNGRIYTRGIADDKGGFMVALEAVRAYQRRGMQLPANIVFVIEGEEEIGSPNLAKVLEKLPNIKPDVAILADMGNFEAHIPTIEGSTRGVARMTVTVQTATGGSHAGLNSNTPSALTALSRLEMDMRDEHGRLRMPGITDQVPPLPQKMVASLKGADLNIDVIRTGANMLPGTRFLLPPEADAADVFLAAGRQFALNRLAVDDGRPRNDDGKSFDAPAGQIIPVVREQWEFRFPPHIDTPEKTAETVAAIRAFLQAKTPYGATVTTTFGGMAIPGWDANLSHQDMGLLQKALAIGYHHPVVLGPSGGGIGFIDPFVRRFPEALVTGIGVEDPHTNAHAADESLDITLALNAARSLVVFFHLMGKSRG